MTEYTNTPILPEKAKELMSLDTEYKEIITYGKIEEWLTAWDGKVYVSFSGGKDSTVLAYLAANWLSHFRTPPWPLNLVFINTGLEYPEIQKFVNEYTDWLRKKFPRVTINLTRLRPKMNIRQVVTKYGYSIVSKEVAGTVYEARKNPNCRRAKKLRGELLDKEGKPSLYNCDNWEFLLGAPFPISDRCCHVMKKASAHRYEGETKSKPMVATMAEEGRQRFRGWLATGCNAFENKRPMGKPMSFWTEQDVLRFIVDRELPIASVYGDIVASDGENDYAETLIDCKLHCTGCQRTGCMFCGFGAHLEKGENRFERMKHTHPKHYDFCIGGGEFDPADGLWKPNEKGLGYGRVLDYIGVRY
nr:MAG TPA: phosphoadenosine-phosphosulfate reductase [Bacteriophage sp.]